ncbi:MAG: twin-arginine translocase subunit TatC [Rhodospirillaceae bacterium]|nr:twin-arginine translocase subunit TatC [Rhodospirillaceae bacterium]|tara:strand:+ start:734 stop:1522 length:789 start_codon:yes stop_codon:yes gene_type:complete
MRPDSTNDEKMPLLDHLAELRRRLIYCFVGVLLAFIVCYTVADELYNFLVRPLADITANDPGRRMIFTGLHEAFFTQIKVAFFGAVFITFPIVAVQVWRFVGPGLYKTEKRAFLPFLIGTPLLFILGASVAYYIVIPLAWRFFIGFEQPSGDGILAMQLEPKVDEYLSLVMRLILAFGICFELPVFILLATQIGLTNSLSLKKKRKYAILISFVVAAVITPPDVISQIMLAVPVIILYELSILFSMLIERRSKSDKTETSLG